MRPPARARTPGRRHVRPSAIRGTQPVRRADGRTDGGAGPRGRTGRRRITTELSGGANRAGTDRAVSDLALISVRLGTGTAASCHSCVRAAWSRLLAPPSRVQWTTSLLETTSRRRAPLQNSRSWPFSRDSRPPRDLNEADSKRSNVPIYCSSWRSQLHNFSQ